MLTGCCVPGPRAVLYYFERCYESGGRLFERIFSQLVFTLFIFEAFTGARPPTCGPCRYTDLRTQRHACLHAHGCPGMCTSAVHAAASTPSKRPL